MEGGLDPELFNHRREPGWTKVFVFSAFLHLVVFSLIFFVPGESSTRQIKGEIYEVNLVEMQAPKPAKPAEPKKVKPAPAKKNPAVTEKAVPAKRIPQTKTTEVEKPVVIAKRTIKREEKKAEKPKESPSKLISQALEKIEKKVKAEERDPLEQALDQVEKKVSTENQDHLKLALNRVEGKVKDSAAKAQGQGMQGSPEGRISNRLYEMEVRARIRDNWTYPALLTAENKKDLEAVFVLRVQSDGKILDSRFKKRSANVIFDQSVMKAIEKSDPLPAFPPGYRMTSDELEITFNLKDLKGD